MNAERVTWWVVFLAFSVVLFLVFFTVYIALLATTIPEGVAYILGLAIFLLLGNRLLFGYGSMILTLDNLIEGREVNRENLINKAKQPSEMVSEASNLSLVIMWLKDLDHYRYTYYGLFSLLMLLALLSKLKLFGSLAVGNYVEGSFWGASTVTVVVWSLDIIAHYLMGKASEKV